LEIGGLTIYLPGLSSNHDGTSDLSLPSS
jgi:hypothetical protein